MPWRLDGTLRQPSALAASWCASSSFFSGSFFALELDGKTEDIAKSAALALLVVVAVSGVDGRAAEAVDRDLVEVVPTRVLVVLALASGSHRHCRRSHHPGSSPCMPASLVCSALAV